MKPCEIETCIFNGVGLQFRFLKLDDEFRYLGGKAWCSSDFPPPRRELSHPLPSSLIVLRAPRGQDQLARPRGQEQLARRRQRQ